MLSDVNFDSLSRNISNCLIKETIWKLQDFPWYELIKGNLTGTLNAFRCKIRQDFGNNIEVDPILDEMRTLHGLFSEVTKAKKDKVTG